MSEDKKNNASDVLEQALEHHQSDKVSIREVSRSLDSKGFDIIMAIAALPLCLPIPVPPGYTTIFAIPLFILAVQMIMGRSSAWLPKWIADKKIKRSTFAKLVEKAGPLLRKIEKISKPRMLFLASRSMQKVLGVIIFVFAISIAIPLPLTNLPPGYGILIIALGLLNRDGLFVLIGLIIGIIGLFITGGILYGSWELISGWFS